ncbi:NAD-dependent epimerase/dehydratase [Cynara cardunculus var. scolymus]|uniref:NAD-dependent epimerase/dehydratase n=1 Tax=Cynara cardunculus var. scolymus TaxID=59895 RepID=A0A103Y445_CYNCS|nr:NAD-dependent epimerase/dehydratase [Cynara cardunculus var. scolymus]
MEQKKTDPGGGGGGRTYCVTGATGYIGSWLVKSLLERGFSVHAAVRNPDNYVQSDIIDPSIRGALNILKSCLRSKSVKRVVFTSSISTMTARNDHGEWLPVVHESCRTSVDVIWNRKSSGWVYVLSKRLTEDAAFQFANENGIRLVSIITTTVAGPFLTSTVPLSIRVLLSPLTEWARLLWFIRKTYAMLTCTLWSTIEPKGDTSAAPIAAQSLNWFII